MKKSIKPGTKLWPVPRFVWKPGGLASRPDFANIVLIRLSIWQRKPADGMNWVEIDSCWIWMGWMYSNWVERVSRFDKYFSRN